MVIKKNLNFVLSFILLFLGVSYFVYSFYFLGILNVGDIIIFLPAIIFFITFCLLINLPKSKIGRLLIIISGVLLLIFTLLISVVRGMFSLSIGPIKSVRYYQEALKSWRSDEKNHLPKAIPKNARNIRFYFSPGLLQMSRELELRYELPSQELDSIFTQYNQSKNLSFVGCHPYFLTFQDNEKKSKDFFEVFCLKTSESSENRGIAINKSTSEILYWVYGNEG